MLHLGQTLAVPEILTSITIVEMSYCLGRTFKLLHRNMLTTDTTLSDTSIFFNMMVAMKYIKSGYFFVDACRQTS